MSMAKKFYHVLLLALFVFALNCEIPVPVKDMALSKYEITRAVGVQAEKYAPAELDVARKKLYESHEFSKKKEFDKAKSAAGDSYKKAVEAYNKAVPLLAKDTLDAAKKSLQEADDAYAEELARSYFSDAKNTIREADDLYNGSRYYDAYLRAKAGDAAALNAKGTALGKKRELQDAIESVKATLAEARKYEADKYAADKTKSADDKVNTAASAYADSKLKVGFLAIKTAKLSADEAYLTALKESAKTKIADADTAVKQAAASEGAAIAKDEMDGAKESLKNANTKLTASDYKEAMVSAEESKRLAIIVLNTKPKKVEPKVEPRDESKDESKDVAKDKDESKEKKDQKAIDEERGYSIYKVKYNKKKSDCLWRIAERHYKDGNLWKIIYKANKAKIKNPNRIYPNISLKIPILKERKETYDTKGKKGSLFDKELKEDDKKKDDSDDSADSKKDDSSGKSEEEDVK